RRRGRAVDPLPPRRPAGRCDPRQLRAGARGAAEPHRPRRQGGDVMSMSAAAFGPASSAAPAVPTTRGARHADATGVNEAAAFAGALAAALGWPALPAPIAD